MTGVTGFGDRFFDAWAHLDQRERRRVSGVEFARRVGKELKSSPPSGSTVGRWKEGTIPDITTVAAIARACDVDPGWLAFGHLSGAPAPPMAELADAMPRRSTKKKRA